MLPKIYLSDSHLFLCRFPKVGCFQMMYRQTACPSPSPIIVRIPLRCLLLCHPSHSEQARQGSWHLCHRLGTKFVFRHPTICWCLFYGLRSCPLPFLGKSCGNSAGETSYPSVRCRSPSPNRDDGALNPTTRVPRPAASVFLAKAISAVTNSHPRASASARYTQSYAG